MSSPTSTTTTTTTAEKPTKYDITIQHTDHKIPFSLEKMPNQQGREVCKVTRGKEGKKDK